MSKARSIRYYFFYIRDLNIENCLETILIPVDVVLTIGQVQDQDGRDDDDWQVLHGLHIYTMFSKFTSANITSTLNSNKFLDKDQMPE
jgi:hypothetical protein